MKRLRMFIAVWVFLAMIANGGCRMTPPREVDGWARSQDPKKVNRSNIFDYMDGAGELYLAYSFAGLEVWNYEKSQQPDILLEIYDMGEPEEAFGVLSFDLYGEEVGIGRKSVYAAGLLRFWKGKYFVRILVDPETAATKGAVMKMGRAVAEKLPGEGSLPELVANLPENGLVEESVHYFHKEMCLDYFYFLAEKNILHLDENTDAVMADYRMPSGEARLLLVQYGSAGAALEAWKDFHATYLNQPPPERGAAHATQIEGGQWVGSWMEERVLFMVFEGKSGEDCEQLLERARSNTMEGR